MHLGRKHVSFFSSVFFLGVALGVFAAGLLSNRHGRRPCLLAGIWAQLISGLLLSLHLSYPWMCLLRLVYGCGFGSTLTMASLTVTECLPMKYRGKTLLVIFTLNSVGKLLGVGLAFKFLSQSSKHWSRYMLYGTLPSLVALVMSWLFVKESFRYLFLAGRQEKALAIIDGIARDNGGNPLSEEEKGQLLEWSQQVFEDSSENRGCKALLREKWKVFFFSMGWFCVAFVAFGEMFIVPFMVSASHHGLQKYFWMHLGEIPSLLLTYPLIDREGFGRKKTLVLLFLASAGCCLLVVAALNSFTLFLAKLVIKATFQVINPFTAESYSTRIRSVAYAINSLTGRIGSALMPFIIYPLYDHHPNAPFLVLSLCSTLGAFSISQIKSDTLKKPLDEKESSGDSPTLEELR
jgi:MFS family permease